MNNKFFKSFVCASLFAIGSLVLAQEVAQVEFNTDLGKARMIEIMHNGPQGINAALKNIVQAETFNLGADIDVKEFIGAQAFHPMLKLGDAFLLTSFDAVISPKDASTVLQDRQHGIDVISKNTQLRKELQNLLEQAAEHEATVIKFLQERQAVLETLPKNWMSVFKKSWVAQTCGQLRMAIPAAISFYLLYKIAPYYQYFYKNATELMIGKTEADFITDGDIQSLFNSSAYQDLNAIDQNKKASYVEIFTALGKTYVCPEARNIYAKAPNTFIKWQVDTQAKLDKTGSRFATIDKGLHDGSFALEASETWYGLNKESVVDVQTGNIIEAYHGEYDSFKKIYGQEQRMFKAQKSVGYGAAYCATGIIGINAASNFYGIYKDHQQGLQIRNVLHAFNKLIDIEDQIEKLCEKHGIKKQFLIGTIQDEDVLDLMYELESNRYANSSNPFVFTPKIRAFVYELYEKDMLLAPIFAAIAEMDVLYAIADKMVSCQDTTNKLCLANFVESDRPIVQGNAFWNILVKNAINNNIHADANVILTGPNAGGKSVTIRAILQNILLAQTFGVAAATEFSLTPFDVIHSYIRVSDDILGGLSLFATEVKRAQDIMQRIKNLSADQKYFFALDELFTGTNAHDGEMCACVFIENIANYPNVQFIYATHFDRLKEVGRMHKYCVNYKINAPAQNEQGQFIRNEKGKLVYPYTLSVGANNISVAKEIAYDAGLFD